MQPGGWETGQITPGGEIGEGEGTPVGERVIIGEDGVGSGLGNEDGGGREGKECR